MKIKVEKRTISSIHNCDYVKNGLYYMDDENNSLSFTGKCKIKELNNMDLITIKELYKNREQYFDKEVTIGGWVRSNRDSKTFGFIVVNDGSYFETVIPYSLSTFLDS